MAEEEREMNGLDLFSGIGGLSVALAPWVRTIAYCESNEFCQAVLLSRMRTGDIDLAPIWDDVRTLCAERMLTTPDIIFGGFPCQDISVAGSRSGLEGERSGLFWEVVRIAKECAPVFIFLENVWPGMSRHVETVTTALEDLGFQCRAGNLAAADVGAPHKRERWFCLAAHPERLKLWDQSGWGIRKSGEGPALAANDGQKEPMADPSRVGCDALGPQANGRIEIGSSSHALRQGLALGKGKRSFAPEEFKTSIGANWWLSEPPMGRVVDGFSDKLARARHILELHALGNSVVPACAQEAFKRLMGLK